MSMNVGTDYTNYKTGYTNAENQKKDVDISEKTTDQGKTAYVKEGVVYDKSGEKVDNSTYSINKTLYEADFTDGFMHYDHELPTDNRYLNMERLALNLVYGKFATRIQWPRPIDGMPLECRPIHYRGDRAYGLVWMDQLQE